MGVAAIIYSQWYPVSKRLNIVWSLRFLQLVRDAQLRSVAVSSDNFSLFWVLIIEVFIIITPQGDDLRLDH